MEQLTNYYLRKHVCSYFSSDYSLVQGVIVTVHCSSYTHNQDWAWGKQIFIQSF